MTDLPDAQAARLLEDLVAIPSPSRHETAAATHFVEWMDRHGFAASIDEAGNAVGTRGNGPDEILLLGHIDTFPGDLPVEVRNGVLYGRGSVDAKGPLCTFAAATTRLEVPDRFRVTVAGAVEEEISSSRGARHIADQRRDHPPYACIIGEPSAWDRVTLAYKGRLLVDLDLRVPFTHSAGADVLPPEAAVDLWLDIGEFCRELDAQHGATRAVDRLLPSLQRIESRDDGAYGKVAMIVGFRLPTWIDPEELEALLRSRVSVARGTVRMECRGHERAYRSGKTNPLVRSLLFAIREHEGEPRFVAKTGTSDMNVVGPAWPDTPIVAYGPGDSGLDHTPDEHLVLEEYLKAIGVLTTALDALMAAPRRT